MDRKCTGAKWHGMHSLYLLPADLSSMTPAGSFKWLAGIAWDMVDCYRDNVTVPAAGHSDVFRWPALSRCHLQVRTEAL